jgi:hypothetical protein
VERIVDQVVNPKILTVFMPQVEDVVYKFLGIEKPKKAKKNHNGMSSSSFTIHMHDCCKITVNCYFEMSVSYFGLKL